MDGRYLVHYLLRFAVDNLTFSSTLASVEMAIKMEIDSFGGSNSFYFIYDEFRR